MGERKKKRERKSVKEGKRKGEKLWKEREKEK